MKLKEFLGNINKLVEKNPELLEKDVVYSADDEGNDFNFVTYSPSIGKYESREFKDKEDIKEVNSICIN